MKIYVLLLTIAILGISGCSDDTLVIAPSGLQYVTTNYQIGFYETGQSGVALINWNGETGTFGLGDIYDGVSINSTTGQLSWDQDLLLGETKVAVIASNSIGSLFTEISLNHKFSGSFTGAYNNNPNSDILTNDDYNLTFMEDGTMTVLTDGFDGAGVYTIDDNGNIDGQYEYDGYVGDFYYFTGNLTYSKSMIPTIEGLWGTDPNDISSGKFENTLD